MKVGIVNPDLRLVQSRCEAPSELTSVPARDKNQCIWDGSRLGRRETQKKGLTPTINAIMLGPSEKACRATRKLLFFSDAQPNDGQGNGQISPHPVADCLLSCAARPVAGHPNWRALAHKKSVARQGHSQGRQVRPTDRPRSRRRREPPEFV